MNLVQLDSETRALLSFAAAIGGGDEDELLASGRACRATGVPAVWMDELLLQSVLMVGWPKALNAFAIWREVGLPTAESLEDGGDYARLEAWRARGEAVCREVYGKNYTRLRENIHALHPALEAWMVTEGYGKTIGRPGLDLARRELCIVLQVAQQGAPRQLHSHLRGARNAGASVEAIDAALELVRPRLGAREWEIVMSLWEKIRA